MRAFEIRQPVVDAIPVVCSIPHTGTYVPDGIPERWTSDHIRSLPMTDWHLHHLYDFLPSLGVTSIHATWSRFLCDLNRPPEPRALYPGRFETGIVAERTFWGDVIWDSYPARQEIDQWKAQVHVPYHEALNALLDETAARFGHCVLLDLHSVASKASEVHPELEYEIYLGNRDGDSCADWLIDCTHELMEAAGLKVVRNNPYKGGYITDTYGRRDDVDALQIEMCQRVYMDENEPGAALDDERFGKARHMLEGILGSLATEASRKIR
ncbi:MAG: N-formylglutamate amidohydrolase [Gammaproteobacteria bacterium]|nr:N-formylglutamate amidohydrolase [Gammaproteobacteria bacterium]